MPSWRICDIDTNDDLEMAKVLSNNLYNKYQIEFRYLNNYKNTNLVLKHTKPHSLLFKGEQISENRLFDVYSNLIYTFIAILSTYKRYAKKAKNYKTHFKILFVYRDWGKETTVNREIIKSLSEYCGKHNVVFLESSY